MSDNIGVRIQTIAESMPHAQISIIINCNTALLSG